MNHLLFTLLTIGVAALSVFPTGARGLAVPTADAQPTELEPPHALPLAVASPAAATVATAASAAANSAAAPQPQLNNDLGEIWQEDDREVLIRNARRAKDQPAGTGSGSGAAGAGSGAAAGKKGRGGGAKKTQKGGQKAAKASVAPVSAAKPAVEKGEDNDEIPSNCRYTKSPWSECDLKTNTRSRTLSLKRGDDCVATRTIQKKCKKACRYEKGAWSECTSGQMSRSDRLKTASDPTCQQTRDVTKNCNPGKAKADKKERPAKNGKPEKGQRKSGRA